MGETPCGATCVAPTVSQCHCCSCHRTFGGLRGFDNHRHEGTCLDPTTMKPPLRVNARGVWVRTDYVQKEHDADQ